MKAKKTLTDKFYTTLHPQRKIRIALKADLDPINLPDSLNRISRNYEKAKVPKETKFSL